MGMTIDEFIQGIMSTANGKAVYASVDNPKVKGVGTPGDTEIESAHVDFDNDGIHVYVTIK